MDKVVILELLEGSFDQGIKVNLEIKRDGKTIFRTKGKLPSNLLIEEQYRQWQESYKNLKSAMKAIKAQETTELEFSSCRKCALKFETTFKTWLNSSDQNWEKIKLELKPNLQTSDEILVIIQTNNLKFQRFPWHLADIFSDYPGLEVVVSLPEYQEPKVTTSLNKNQVNIFTLLGSSTLGDNPPLDLASELNIIEILPGINLEFLDAESEEFSLEELKEKLRSQVWDIFFYTGHSHTEAEIGYLDLTETLKITLIDLKDALVYAISQGLKLAIFNSCDGLGLAKQLAEFHIPQIIVMREPIPSEVAQDFLTLFLKYYSRGKSFYTSMTQVRKDLEQRWEIKYPGVSWLPVICQNPTQEAMTWLELQQGFRSESFSRPRPEEILLNKMKSDWIEGVLKKSLQDSLQVELGLEERWDMITQPWGIVWETSEQLRQELPSGINIIHVVRNMASGNTLLILGEPGAGKTTELLRIAEYYLAHAKYNKNLPIPVVFNLSTWQGGQQTLWDWLIQELDEKYAISKSISQRWLKQEKLLLLLDGLDEVKTIYQTSCIEAINLFIKDYGMTKIIVCSRIQDYQSISNLLKFHKAIFIQNLTPEKIEQYLAKADAGSTEFQGLRKTLKTDLALQELAQSPLMLNIMTLVYKKHTFSEISKMSLEERRRELFDGYIKQMLYRRCSDIKHSKVEQIRQAYSDAQTQHWLTWLANNMNQTSQTIFLIERMQPSGLPNKQQKWLYTFLIGLEFGGLVGLIIGLMVWLTLGILFQFPWGIVLAVVIGLWVAFSVGFWAILTIGNFSDPIKPVERLTISPRKLIDSLIGGIIAGVVTWQLSKMLGFLFVGILVGIVFGLNGPPLEETTEPNQGIKQSIKNAVIFSIIGAIGLGIPAIFMTQSLLNIITNSLALQVKIGSVTVILVSILTGLLFGLTQAGVAALQHLALRLILYLNRDIPWNYEMFLNYATERIFLQKVGGGYIFIHRLLRDHFATLKTNKLK
ncbi:NACHT domain-containing protein [Planktothrix agardhii]|jgi:hypothetical protein|uniref:NACHT domain-containing protein n=1 Tax=Planktothrix agardhii TaxID=1160 RepID=UPI0028A68DDD|nr:NACHT domain-containing protein [Planktothrix agardhii]